MEQDDHVTIIRAKLYAENADKTMVEQLVSLGVSEKEIADTPDFRHLLLDIKPRGRTLSSYCNFAYSALASFRMGMSGSASFHLVKKSW
jgi:hypothetical protein